MGIADYLICGIYLAFVAAIGVVFFRSQRATRDFFLAGRSLGWILVGISLMGSLASSIGFVGAPTAGLASGAIMLWSLVALPLSYPLVVRVFIPFFMSLRVYTPYEYLERRFDLRIRLLASGLFIFWRIIWMAVTVYVPVMVLNVVTQGAVPVVAGVVALGALATLYATFGGMRAVVWTDVAQCAVMFGAAGAAIYALQFSVPGGVPAIWETARAAGKIQWTANVAGWDGAGWLERLRLYLYTDFTVPAIIAGFTMGKLGNYCVDQVMVQRYLSARSIATARRGFLLNCVAFALYFTLMTVVGIGLFAFRKHANLPPDIRPDGVFPYFIAHFMPMGAAGLVLSAIMAAAMSTVDSGVNSCVSAIANDFYYRLVRGVPSLELSGAGPDEERARVRLSRYSSLVLGTLVILFGCLVYRLGDTFELALKVVNSFIGPLFAIFVLGMFSRRASARGVFWGATAGIAVTALTVVSDPLSVWLLARNGGTGSLLIRIVQLFDIGFLWTSCFGFVITWGMGYMASIVFFERSAKTENWTYQAFRAMSERGDA